jgi:hypothetical protein
MKQKKGFLTIIMLTLVSIIVFWKRKEIQQKIQSVTGKAVLDESTSSKQETYIPPSNNSTTQTGYTECVQFPLRRGCKGSKVLLLQKRLNQLFNSGITEDGYFGAQTESALLAKGYTKTVSAADMTRLHSPIAKLRS